MFDVLWVEVFAFLAPEDARSLMNENRACKEYGGKTFRTYCAREWPSIPTHLRLPSWYATYELRRRFCMVQQLATVPETTVDLLDCENCSIISRACSDHLWVYVLQDQSNHSSYQIVTCLPELKEEIEVPDWRTALCYSLDVTDCYSLDVTEDVQIISASTFVSGKDFVALAFHRSSRLLSVLFLTSSGEDQVELHIAKEFNLGVSGGASLCTMESSASRKYAWVLFPEEAIFQRSSGMACEGCVLLDMESGTVLQLYSMGYNIEVPHIDCGLALNCDGSMACYVLYYSANHDNNYVFCRVQGVSSNSMVTVIRLKTKKTLSARWFSSVIAMAVEEVTTVTAFGSGSFHLDLQWRLLVATHSQGVYILTIDKYGYITKLKELKLVDRHGKRLPRSIQSCQSYGKSLYFDGHVVTLGVHV
eukprot:GILK01009094.1.p1 GENE.GILK01009094.1~~GILK01009094.1.p1  ORF type:complete len:419 (-),score=23.31 GILK01009094.1:136-1392(-)